MDENKRSILCIDLKSFFASAECVNRGLDPFTTPLVVSDISRGNGAMTLAATPYLRSLGVESRSRVFTLPKNIDIIFAPPRMALYAKASNEVNNVYKEFIDSKDIHIYSIDEVFIDATDYLNYYKTDEHGLALKIMNRIKEKTGLTTTCGIGPNIFLAKVALDTEAKKNKDFIGIYTYNDIETKLWTITPLRKVWGIGLRLEKHLNDLGIHSLGEINKYSREFYIKRFGKVCGNLIWCKANGIDFTRVQDMNRQEKEKSMSMSQILTRDYDIEGALLIIKEMTELLTRKLRRDHLSTKRIFLAVYYSKELNYGFNDALTLDDYESNENKLFLLFKQMYFDHIEDLPIRRVLIGYTALYSKNYKQLNLFESENEIDEKYYEVIDEIKEKFGPTTILKASSLLKDSTIKNRENFKNVI